jgi:hypothetical protein
MTGIGATLPLARVSAKDRNPPHNGQSAPSARMHGDDDRD